jgi:hypothetical protein
LTASIDAVTIKVIQHLLMLLATMMASIDAVTIKVTASILIVTASIDADT